MSGWRVYSAALVLTLAGSLCPLESATVPVKPAATRLQPEGLPPGILPGGMPGEFSGGDGPIPTNGFPPFAGRGASEPRDPPVPAVSIKVRVPAEVEPGKEINYRITVTNTSRAAAHHVTVRNPLPTGAKFVRATPEPSALTPVLTWNFGTLEGCAKKEINLVLLPGEGSEVQSCARVQFEHGQCVRTRITRPDPGRLQLRKIGPTTALQFDVGKFQLEVRNLGKTPVREVVVTDVLPKGADFSNSNPATKGDNPLVWNLGELAPGQVKRIDYEVIFQKPGEFINKAKVEAAGGIREETSHTTRVGNPAISVAISGPRSRQASRSALYKITVHNTGSSPATGVRVVNELPKEITFEKASDGGRLEGNEVRWTLGNLLPGTRKVVAVVVRAKETGLFKSVATATADRGLSEQAFTETRFKEEPGLNIEIDKGVDPLEVGQEMTLTVRLLNTGKAAETKLTPVVTVGEGLQVLETKGLPGTVRGNKVELAVVGNLAPGGEAVIFIRVKGVKPGAATIEAETSSEGLAGKPPVKVDDIVQVEAGK